MLSYLKFVSGAAKGTPYCPFVRAIEDSNGYSVRVFHKSVPSPLSDYLAQAAELSMEEFLALQAKAVAAGKNPHQLSLVSAFAGKDAGGIRFHTAITTFEPKMKLPFNQNGLMLGIMGPHHAPGGREGGTEPLFISKLPLMIVRKMHKSDQVFMRTPEQKGAYKKFFGEAMD